MTIPGKAVDFSFRESKKLEYFEYVECLEHLNYETLKDLEHVEHNEIYLPATFASATESADISHFSSLWWRTKLILV